MGLNELHMPDLWKETALGTVAVEEAGASASGVSYAEGRKPTTFLYHRQAGEGRNTV